MHRKDIRLISSSLVKTSLWVITCSVVPIMFVQLLRQGSVTLSRNQTVRSSLIVLPASEYFFPRCVFCMLQRKELEHLSSVSERRSFSNVRQKSRLFSTKLIPIAFYLRVINAGEKLLDMLPVIVLIRGTYQIPSFILPFPIRFYSITAMLSPWAKWDHFLDKTKQNAITDWLFTSQEWLTSVRDQGHIIFCSGLNLWVSCFFIWFAAVIMSLNFSYW